LKHSLHIIAEMAICITWAVENNCTATFKRCRIYHIFRLHLFFDDPE